MEQADIVDIPDFSNETLLALAERLETSRSFQEMIIREVELDEVYRRVDSAVRSAQELDADRESEHMLERVRTLVFEAHDLASEGRPLEAAGRLRAAMSLEPRAP